MFIFAAAFIEERMFFFDNQAFAGVVKLVDTLDLGSSASRRGGSSPSIRTKKSRTGNCSAFFLSKIYLQTK